MASLPAYKPQTPFLAQLPGGFQPSLMIRFKGKIVAKRGRCSINFINSPALSNGQDIMFHLSIRLDEKVIVRNSFRNHQWEMEERYGAFRISYQVPFEIIILAEYPHYKIAVNGVHLGVFRHRLPLHLVQYVQISGDVDIEHVLFEQDVNSAQEQAVIGAIVNSAPSMPVRSTFPIGRSTLIQPASYSIVSSTTSVPATQPVPYPITSSITSVPAAQQLPYPIAGSTVAHQVAPIYPVLPGSSGYNQMPPAYSQSNAYGAPQYGNDPPPPYPIPSAPQQNSDVWVHRKY